MSPGTALNRCADASASASVTTTARSTCFIPFTRLTSSASSLGCAHSVFHRPGSADTHNATRTRRAVASRE